MKFMVVLFSLFTATSAMAGNKIFKDYNDYRSFADPLILERNFVPLVKALGGEDEYTDEQLDRLEMQLLVALPKNFSDVAVVKRVELEEGFSQEMRAYWNSNNSYVFYYSFLQQRKDGLIVLKFKINISSEQIFSQF